MLYLYMTIPLGIKYLMEIKNSLNDKSPTGMQYIQGLW